LGTDGFIERMIVVFVPIGISMATLSGMYKILKVEEFDDILNIFKKKIQK